MVSVMFYPCMFGVALSMDLFVLCVAHLTGIVAICLDEFVILLLNAMGLLSVADRPCIVSQRMCVLCLWSQ